MPARNDGRASRRPLPRQLDMSGWSVDSSSPSSIEDGDLFRSSSAVSRETSNLGYYKTREPSSQYGSIREEEYRPQQTSAREELPPQREEIASRTSEFYVRSFSSGHSTSKGSTFDSAFTSMPSRRDHPRESRSNSSRMGVYEEARRCHDNQREAGGRYGSTDCDQEGELWKLDRSTQSSLRPSSVCSESRFQKLSGFSTTGDSLSSLRIVRADYDSESNVSNSKADSIREVESPNASRGEPKVRGSRHDSNGPTRKAPEIRTSSLTATFENQDKPNSPTNSETSFPPFSPDSEGDQRLRERYPSIPSPVSSDKSSSRKMGVSSPCSSISTDRTSASRVSKQSASSQRLSQSAMTDLREDLYAFRKQMREVFIRVEDMVDVHRSFFKSDPSTGSPAFNGELQQEAEQLANEAFKQLTDLRRHFTRLAKDFQRSEELSTEPPRQPRRQGSTTKSTSLRRVTRTPSNQALDGDDASLKGSEVREDNDSDGQDRISIDGTCTREQSPNIRGRSSQDDNEDASSPVVADSVRSTASTFLSSQLQSRWRDSSAIDAESVVTGSRTRVRSSSIVSDASSLPDQPHSSFSAKPSEPDDTDSIFKDFDKRMEEIRCSLNAIASGKSPHSNNVAAPPKFCQRGAGSPIRVMMDAARTKSTLREASRISRRFDHEDGNSDDGKIGRGGSREAELRHLLQELKHINTSNDDDD